jgi:ribonuclease BN (tRNA processing enzyme)
MTDPITATTALTITLLGTGTPLPDADRAGPATLIEGARAEMARQ